MSFFSFRLGSRAISSVIPKSELQVKDFKVENEPILGYLPGSAERIALESALEKHANKTEECPIIIGGKEYRTDDVRYQVMVSSIKKLIAGTVCFFGVSIIYILK